MTDKKEIDLEQFEGHTAGPWHVDRDEYPEATILDVAHHNSDGKTRRVVAEVFNGSYNEGHPTGEDEANAKLIAAAPELLREVRRQIGEILLLRHEVKLRDAVAYAEELSKRKMED